MGIPDVEPEASEEEMDVEVMGAFGRLPVDECVAMALLCELSLGMEPGEPITPDVLRAAALRTSGVIGSPGSIPRLSSHRSAIATHSSTGKRPNAPITSTSISSSEASGSTSGIPITASKRRTRPLIALIRLLQRQPEARPITLYEGRTLITAGVRP